MAAAIKPKQYRKRDRESDDEDDTAVRPQAKLASKLPVPANFATGKTTSSTVGGVLTDTAYSGSGTGVAASTGGGAFAYNETETSTDNDARAQMEKKLALQAQAVTDLEQGRKVYRGQAGYTNFYMKDGVEAVTRAKAAGTLGPMRAPSNVRGITLVDYKPDVCKDYRETGQCPFGDSCIFLHDRSEYKSGWQLELEWQALQKKKADKLAAKLAAGGTAEDDASGDEGDGDKIDMYKKKLPGTTWSNPILAAKEAAKKGKEESGDLPLACYICREGFKLPIVLTQCGHYFCERCALDRHKKSPFCAVCNKQTHGIFNAAPKLMAKLRAEGAIPDEDDQGGGWGDALASEGQGQGQGGIDIQGQTSALPAKASGGWSSDINYVPEHLLRDT